MRAAIYNEYGDPEVLQIVQCDVPVPKGNEIKIEVVASSVTPGDVANRRGNSFLAKLFTGIKTPRNPILGYEYSGIVTEIGTDVTKFQDGDEVFGTTGRKGGAHAEYVCIDEHGMVAHKPVGLSFESAATLPIGSLTSLYFLRKASVGEGHAVLLYGASGSVGTAAVQILKNIGASVTAVCSKANHDLVRSLGADIMIDYEEQDFRTNGVKYDFVFDAVGKISVQSCKESLRDTGLFISVYMPISHVFHGRVVGGIVEEKPEDINLIKSLAEQGILVPVIDRIFKLGDISLAHEYVELGHKTGNVVIQIR